MSGAERARAELAAVPGWDGRDTDIVRALRHGRSADTWLVRHGSEHFVLRVDHAGAGVYGHDRAAEVEIIAAAAQHGLTPPLVYAAPERGVIVRRLASGVAWRRAQLEDPKRLARLGRLLRRLHGVEASVRRFDLAGAIARYARRLASAAADAVALNLLAELAAAAPWPAVFCHNDLVHDNIVEGERLWLIDWEYAGLGNALFDLAVIVQHHELGPQSQAALLDAYFERAPRPPAAELERWCRIYAGVHELFRGVVESAPAR